MNYTEKPAPLSRVHFNSQIEDGYHELLNVSPKKQYSLYSCSCFQTKEEIENLRLLPRFESCETTCVMGEINKELGSILIKGKGTHVHWFLYENSDPSYSNFK